MTFPVTVTHRKAEAIIYGKSEGYPYYRVAWHAGGKRVLKSCRTFSEAKREAKAKLKQLAKGNPSVALTVKEASHALAIREALHGFRADTGRNLSSVEAVTGYIDAVKLLPAGHGLTDAVRAYLATVVTVRRKALSEAVAEFNAERQPKTVVKPGKIRPDMHPTYYKDTSRWLNEVADMFPGHAVSDLTKDHLNKYVGSHSELSPKSRNDRRVTSKLFLKWCVARDYLNPAHRLFEAVGLKHEPLDAAPIDYYRVNELRALLEHSEGQMRAVIALQGLAGLRLQECLRLDWREVFGIPGHIEVTGAIAKGRQRRLVEICPVLELWLQPYRGTEGQVTTQWETLNGYMQAFVALRKSLKIPSRKNGLRHGYITMHYASNSNENLTSALAGNSPAMIHAHYRGLATKAEAEKWFAVAPAQADNVIVLESQTAQTNT
jgi:integrase